VELLIDRVIVTAEEVEIRYVIPTDPSSEHVRFCHLRSDYLHHPAAWEDLKSLRWQKLLPIDYLAFLGQFLRPTHQHFFGGGFARTFDQFHTPS